MSLCQHLLPLEVVLFSPTYSCCLYSPAALLLVPAPTPVGPCSDAHENELLEAKEGQDGFLW